jgi:hypothetical protein
MPKQKQYEDALGSVFDFIFTEAQKPPDKRKPVKITGVDGTSEYIDALAAVLESPGQFVNKTTVDAFNDAVNPEIAVVDLGPEEQIKFKLLDVKGVLNNDFSFIDKQFERLEANRKLGKMAWAGERLSGVVAATWAKKYGLDLETQNALFNMGGEDVFLDKSSKRPEEKLGAWAKNRDYLGKVVKGEFGDYRNVSENTLKMSFGDERGKEIYKELQKAFKAYDEGIRNGLKDGEISLLLDKVSDSNYKTLYPVFESHNMAAKEARARTEGDTELADKYKSAQKGVELFAQRNLRDKYFEKKKDELKQYKEDLSTLLKSSNPDKNLIKDLRSKISDTNKELRLFNTQKMAQKLGEWDGLWSSTSSAWEYTMGGQLLPAILSGDFFDKRKNTMFDGKFMPVDEKEIRGISRFIQTDKDDIPKFKIPKVMMDGKGKEFMNVYYKMMTEVYYYTPATLVRSLSTGEVFAYRAFKQQEKFLKLMEKEGWLDKVNLDELFGKDGEAYLHSFTDILDQEKFDKLLKFAKKNERLQKMAYQFGTLGRAKKRFTKLITDRLEIPIQKLREQVGARLLLMIKDGPARELITKWVSTGGIKVLLEGIKTAVIAALGVTTAGVGTIVGFAVDLAASLAISVAMKIAKPVVKVSLSLLILGTAGIIGIIIIVLMFVFSIFGVTTKGQYAHVAPGEVVLGQTDFKLPPADGTSGGFGVPFDASPLPDGVSCLLGSSSHYICTQGPGGSFSHRSLPNAIDLAYIGYFYAPSFCGQGNCYILENGDYPYCNGYAGGQVLFEAEYGGHTYKFKLVHVEMDPALSVGSELSAGQVVARIMTLAETGTACSTGAHLHLEGWYDGAPIDPSSILRESPSNGGFGCNISSCGE